MECGEAAYVLQTVLMVYPNQASSLQGSHNESCDILAVDDLGIGSGWQQSKQNQALLAVVGQYTRTECSSPLCCRTHMTALFAADIDATLIQLPWENLA